jgi:hypothetical protein
VLLLAVVLALTVYRLTRLVVRDEFPPVARPREWVIRRLGADHPVAYLVECPWCMSFWVAAAVVVVVDCATSTSVPLPALWVPALSATTGLIGNLWDVPAEGS